MNKLLVLTRDQAEFKQKLLALNLPDLEVYAPNSPAEIQQQLEVCNLVLGDPPITKNYINAMPRLQWLQSTFTGIDALVNADLRQDYLLTNLRFAFSQSMAEYVLGYILMFEKRLDTYADLQKQKKWLQQPASSLNQRTLGILGTGSVGQVLARMAQAFSMQVLGYRRQAEPVEYFDQVYSTSKLREFLGACDYVVNTLPTTFETRGLINKTTLAQLKPSSVFINVGRGDTVIQADLIDHLQNCGIKAAVLDVFEQEPLPPNSPLWTMPNVYITPHISGYVISDLIFKVFADNYRRFINQQPLTNLVDFAKGY